MDTGQSYWAWKRWREEPACSNILDRTTAGAHADTKRNRATRGTEVRAWRDQTPDPVVERLSSLSLLFRLLAANPFIANVSFAILHRPFSFAPRPSFRQTVCRPRVAEDLTASSVSRRRRPIEWRIAS